MALFFAMVFTSGWVPALASAAGFVSLSLIAFMLYPIAYSALNPVVLYDSAVRIGKHHRFNDLVSISFDTGTENRAFFRGFGFFTVQRIYCMDKDKKEYCRVVDIDHLFKRKREANSLRKMKDFLIALEKEHLVSDWAQR